MAGKIGRLKLGIDTRIRQIWFIGLLVFNTFARIEISLILVFALICITVSEIISKKIKFVYPVIILFYCLVWHLIAFMDNSFAISAALTLPSTFSGFLLVLLFCNRQSILVLTKGICWYFSWLPHKHFTVLYKNVFVAFSALLVVGEEFKRSWILCKNRFPINGYDIFVCLRILSVDFFKRIIIQLHNSATNLNLRVKKIIPSEMAATIFPTSKWKFIGQLCGTLIFFAFLIAVNSDNFPFMPRLEVGQ